jgi:hypothetical protein
MIWEVFTDSTRLVEALHESPCLLHELIPRYGRHGSLGTFGRTSNESTSSETVGPVSWPVQPRKVVAEHTAWLTPLADKEQLIINDDLEWLHSASLGSRSFTPWMGLLKRSPTGRRANCLLGPEIA